MSSPGKTPGTGAKAKKPSGASSSAGRSRASPRIQAMKAAKREEMRRANAATAATPGRDVLPADPFQAAHDARDVTRGETAVAYDEAMLAHRNPWDPEHIESPRRLERALERCRELGLLERCRRVPSRKATDEELGLVHCQAHLDVIRETVALPADEIKSRCLRRIDNSVFMNEHSLECARLATGAAVDVAADVFRGDAQNGMALVRPPGHHAGRDEIIGFCLTNHVAVAARRLLRQEGAKRIMVVDFDVHHGQGTQREFYGESSLLYVSIHRHEYGRYWPHLRESDYDHIGDGAGTGFNVNVPLNQTGMKDSDYMALFHQLILPLGFEFQPEVVLVSAGYDAAVGCPEGEMALSPMVYGHFLSSLMSLAGGKVAVVLEGGYFVESVAEGAAMTLRALLGDPCFSLGKLERPVDSLRDSLLNALAALRSHWQLLRVQDEYSISTYDALKQTDCHEPALFYEGESFAAAREQSKQDYDPKNFYWKHSQEAIDGFMEVLGKMKRTYLAELSSALPPRKKVAVVYDEDMLRHSNMEEPGHPEQPARVSNMMAKLAEYGLLDRSELMRIDSRRATREEVGLCHSQKHFEEMLGTVDMTQKERANMADRFDSIYFNKDSFDSALLSCGSLLNVVDCVCNGDSLAGAALIRPPGHHAEADEACGFCLFNNVAIAAKYALDQHGLKRVLVLDWDVHHGNGIQNMFYEDDRVLYVSLHRFDWGTFFPGREEANCTFVGEGRGKGFNVNVPFNGSGMGDKEYLFAFLNVVLPVCYQFDPQLVLISAGFDAARGDPLGHFKLSPQMYGHMTRLLANLAGGKTIVALEGGYNLNSIALSMTMCVKALLGDPMPNVEVGGEIKASAVTTVRDVIRALSPHWSCLSFGLRLPDSFQDLKESLDSGNSKQNRTPEPKGSAKADIGVAVPPPYIPFSSPVPSSAPYIPFSSPYIPSQYGVSHSFSSCVNTVSLSSMRTQPRETDSAKRTGGTGDGKGKTEEALADLHAQLKTLQVAGPSSDYVPSEYGGGNFDTSFVQTLSSARMASKCEVTDAPKKGSRDASAERNGKEESAGKN